MALIDGTSTAARAGRAARRPRPWLAGLVLLVLAASLPARTPPGTRPTTVPTVGTGSPTTQAVQAQIARLAQVKDLDPAVRAKATDAYKQALAQLQVAREWRSKAAAFEAAAKQAPGKLAAARKQLSSSASQPAATAPAEAPLAELEQLLAAASAEVTAATKAQADLAGEPKRRADRRLAIPKLVAAAQQRLDEIDKQLAAIPKDDPPELAAAQRALLEAQKEATRQEIDACQKELASYDAERELLTANADLASRRLARAETRRKGLQELVERRGREEADRAAREAEQAAMRAARTHPVLQGLAQVNVQLADERSDANGPAARISAASQTLENVKELLKRRQEELRSLIEKEKAVGKTATFGVLLRKQQAEMTDVRQYRRRARTRQEEISAAHLRLIELQERRAALSDIDAAVGKTVAALPSSVPAAQRDRIRRAARELLEDRRKSLDALIRDYEAYFGKLIDLDVQARALVAKAEELAAYIDERVLWIRSAEPVGWPTLANAVPAARWLLGPDTWRDGARALYVDARQGPLTVAAGLLALAGLLLLRRRLGHTLGQTGEAAGRGTAAGFLPTLLALVISIVRAVTLPGFLWLVAWRLAASPGATDPVRAVAAGLRASVAVWITFGLLVEVCRPNGLARAHFHWPVSRVEPLRRTLRVATPILAVLGFLLAAMEWQGNEAWKNSLGRLGLIGFLVVLAVFVQRLLRPKRGASAASGAGGRSGRPAGLRLTWYLLAVAAPALLALLAAVGFHYTAVHLTGRLAMTFWLIVGLVLLNGLALRWMGVAFRRLALRRARQQAAARAAARGAAAPGDGEAPAAEEPEAPEEEIRLDRISKQTRQSLRSALVIAAILGAWGIWADSLPALAALRRVELWEHTVTTTVETAAPDGTAARQTVERAEPVTLADAGLAVLVVVVTVVAARNVPGLLAVIVLQRIQLDAGVRYATGAILRYVIGVTGTILAFHFIGIGWSSVQWLVAAMTVGLGFGLQEIFANFVSGLIILFERPIRIGDTVTIGETAGTVTRIRIRATTITDWDRKELIVPNKEFVTGRLVNWSLSDKVLRVILRVGIAYGSDTDLAEKLLYEKAGEHPLVLGDPKPVVLFSQFGDNSLNFELRVYITGIEHYLKVWHDLNMAIDRAFRQAGITIAFPQQDVHLDTLQPLEIRVLPMDRAAGDRADD